MYRRISIGQDENRLLESSQPWQWLEIQYNDLTPVHSCYEFHLCVNHSPKAPAFVERVNATFASATNIWNPRVVCAKKPGWYTVKESRQNPRYQVWSVELRKFRCTIKASCRRYSHPRNLHSRASTMEHLCFWHGSGLQIQIIQINDSKLKTEPFFIRDPNWQWSATDTLGIGIPPQRDDERHSMLLRYYNIYLTVQLSCKSRFLDLPAAP